MILQMPTAAQTGRDTTIYVRVQRANKEFLTKESKTQGFKDVASFTDALLTQVRLSASAKKVTKKSTKKAAKKAAKK